MSKVIARFAYWQTFGVREIEPLASYLIVESDNPKLCVGSNVSPEFLLENGVPIPITPTYSTWVRHGKPVYRGEDMSRVIQVVYRP